MLSRLETSYLKDVLTGQRFVAVKDDFLKLFLADKFCQIFDFLLYL